MGKTGEPVPYIRNLFRNADQKADIDKSLEYFLRAVQLLESQDHDRKNAFFNRVKYGTKLMCTENVVDEDGSSSIRYESWVSESDTDRTHKGMIDMGSCIDEITSFQESVGLLEEDVWNQVLQAWDANTVEWCSYFRPAYLDSCAV